MLTLINCTGVHTRQFICSAGQNPLLTLAARAAASLPTSRKFMTTKNNNRKAGAKRTRSKRSFRTPAKGTSGGTQRSRKR
uniref:Uncharacterized protein n=1 Tax=Rhinolophus ferrumequinum TaxID=59479 RepID=A0A671FF93_RHIFE